MEEKNYEAIVEAILFTMGESVELEKIAAALELDKKETKKIIENLMKEYEKPSIGMKIIELRWCLSDVYQKRNVRVSDTDRKTAEKTCAHRCTFRDTLHYCIQAANHKGGD